MQKSNESILQCIQYEKPRIKKRPDLNPDNNDFYERKLQVIVTTLSGKPLWIYYGDEITSGIWTATVNAIQDKLQMQHIYGNDNRLQYIQQNGKKMYFKQIKQLMFIVISQPDLCDVQIQSIFSFLNNTIISLLTDRINQTLKIRQNYSTDHLLSHHTYLAICVKNSTKSPCVFTSTIPTHPLSPNIRQQVQNQLKSIKAPIVIMMTLTHIICVQQNSQNISSLDVLTLMSLIQNNQQFQNGVNWMPFCVPSISADGMLQMMIQFQNMIGIIAITDSTEADVFDSLKTQITTVFQKIEVALEKDLYLNQKWFQVKISSSVNHFMICQISKQQLYLPFIAPLGKQNQQSKEIINGYAQVYENYCRNKSNDFFFSMIINGYNYFITQQNDWLVFTQMSQIANIQDFHDTLSTIFKMADQFNDFCFYK